jgi:hypothetical protein
MGINSHSRIIKLQTSRKRTHQCAIQKIKKLFHSIHFKQLIQTIHLNN